MKPNKTILALSLVFMISACTTATTTPEATVVVMATPVISAEDLAETQCPLNIQIQADAANRLPRVYSNGMCGLHFGPNANETWIGLFLGYPAGWTVIPASEDGTSIIFELEPRVIYLQAFQSDLTLEQADQVTYSIEPGIPSEPVINPEEIIKDKSLQTIGDKEVMILSTTLSEQTIMRYFLARSAPGKTSTLYMFQFTVLAPDMDNSQLIGFIEELIGKMAFDQ